MQNKLNTKKHENPKVPRYLFYFIIDGPDVLSSSNYSVQATTNFSNAITQTVVNKTEENKVETKIVSQRTFLDSFLVKFYQKCFHAESSRTKVLSSFFPLHT